MTPPDLELFVPRSVAAAEQRALTPEVVERRDPTAATRQLQYVSPGLPMIPEWDAAKAFRFGYIANVVAFRCIQLTAHALSNVPLVAGAKRGVPNVDQQSSPLARLFGPPPGGPAPKLSARKLIRWSVAQQIVTGRRAWEIETVDGTADGLPVAFWPLASASLEVEPSKGGVEWFRVFHYGASHDRRTLSPAQVFYGWDPAGLDFRQSESALQAARFDLSLVTLADRYSIAFLRNNAVPATVITTTAFPDDDHRRRFQEQWTSEFGGPENAGRTKFNEAGEGDGPVGDTIDIKVLGLSHKDAQLAEARKDMLQQIAIALGTPWSKLDASGRTFDNAEAEDRSWWEDRIEPLMADFEDDINMQLAPRLGGDVCWFDRSQVRALQRKIVPVTQSVGAHALVQAQLMWVNEARADYGLPPLVDGDRMMTVEEIQALKASVGDESIRAALLAIESRGAGGDVPQNPSLEAGDPPAPLALPPAPEEDRGPSPEEIEARRARIWRATDAIVTTLESRWERALRRLFTRQLTSTLARLKGKRGRQALGYGPDGLPEQRDSAPEIDPSSIFDAAFWTDETRQAVGDLYEQVTADSLSRLAEAFGLSFDLDAPWVGELIEARANQLAGPVTQTTYDAITAALREGVVEGESIEDLATRIRDVFADAGKRRSVVIARTEVISAYNGAAVTGASTLPADVVAGQEWIATRDGRTRAAHASADGQVVAIGQPFEVGGDSLAYPGDPSGRSANTVQCRCAVAFLTPEEMAERAAGRGRMVEARTARGLFDLVNEHTDLLAWRRALEGAAA